MLKTNGLLEIVSKLACFLTCLPLNPALWFSQMNLRGDIKHIPNVGLIVACPAPGRGKGQSHTKDCLQKENSTRKDEERLHAMTGNKKIRIKVHYCGDVEGSASKMYQTAHNKVGSDVCE